MFHHMQFEGIFMELEENVWNHQQWGWFKKDFYIRISLGRDELFFPSILWYKNFDNFFPQKSKISQVYTRKSKGYENKQEYLSCKGKCMGSHREDKGFTTARENDTGSQKSHSKWKV